MIWYLSGSTLFPTNNLDYTTFFQANHSINHRNRLYFISVFIYTCIKVKLTKGRKRNGFAMTESNHTYRHSFWAAKNRNNLNRRQSKTQFRPRHKMMSKANPKIRESAFYFAARIGEIIPDMPYLYEVEVSGRKGAISPIFPSVLR